MGGCGGAASYEGRGGYGGRILLISLLCPRSECARGFNLLDRQTCRRECRARRRAAAMPVAAVVPVAAGMLPTCWQLLARRRYAVGVMIAAGDAFPFKGLRD